MQSNALKNWIEATRPKTLAAALVPVLVGGALAFDHNTLLILPTFVALVCAILIQIGTNFANDYYDFVKGSDTEDRVGFKRASANGLIHPETMKKAAFGTMLLAFLLGMYLVWHGGWVILLIGVLSILFGIAYTGGPLPLAYNGLGDVFVFIFFGLIAVMGTYYINSFEWSMQAFWASLAVGALCTNILVVNNLRDVESDKRSNKKTLGVIFGETFLKLEYTALMLLAYAIPPHFLVQEGYGLVVLLPLLLLPLALKLTRGIWTINDKTKLNKVLEKTAQFMVLFGVLFSIGLILG